jgi:ferrous iron transport protein B
MSDHVIGVVGNPNCGKTTLFNALTGTKQRVGNWPGVTVDRKSGEYAHAGKKIEVVDLPGIYSLSAASLDEEVARDYILSGEADLIVNIIDASNLERNLYLTVQLLEMQVPMVLALNMMDMARERRIDIDIPLLSQRLGCPVVPLVASQGKGIDELNSGIKSTAVPRRNPSQSFKSCIPPKYRRRWMRWFPWCGTRLRTRK